MSTFTAVPSDPAQPAFAAPAPPPAVTPQADEQWWNNPDPTPDSQGLPAAPQAPPADQWFLRSPDGKIAYRTADAALQGAFEKDRYIEQQKAEIAQLRAIAAQAGGPGVVPQAPTAAASQNAQYQGLVAALASAVERKDGSFDQAMAQYIQQQNQNALQPMQPLLEYAAMNRAMDEAAHRYDPNIPAFVRSPAYAKTLDKWHGLKTVINVAASAPHMQTADGRTYGELLPEFLAQVYLVAKAAAPAAQPVQRPAPQSATPPQVIRPGAPQGYPAPVQPMPGGFRNPFDEAWAQVPDIALTAETLGR